MVRDVDDESLIFCGIEVYETEQTEEFGIFPDEKRFSTIEVFTLFLLAYPVTKAIEIYATSICEYVMEKHADPSLVTTMVTEALCKVRTIVD